MVYSSSMTMKFFSIFPYLIAIMFKCCQAKIRLQTFINSHMVLQREPHRARIWGWANPNTIVSVKLINNEDSDTTQQQKQRMLQYHSFVKTDDVDGSWAIELPPQSASIGFSFEISDDDTKIILNDIAFGDIYLCSGQSNMVMSVNDAFNATAEIEDSKNYPHLRLATVNQTIADNPQFDVHPKANYTWARSSPNAMRQVGDDGFSWFSAACYFFGRELYKSFLDSTEGLVPIGLLASSWGGQKVETFSSPDALSDKSCGGINDNIIGKEDKHSTNKHDENVWIDNSIKDINTVNYDDTINIDDGAKPTPKSSQIWNAMIHPFLPMRFTGVIWYQGEANVEDPMSYSCRFPAMITDWKIKFELPNLSFFYVQLAAFSNNDFTNIRAAQDVALQLPKVGVAIAIDLGDPTSPSSPIHPRRKQEVGRRLSLVTRVVEYGQRNVVYKGPVLESIQVTTKSNNMTAILQFDTSCNGGLHLYGTAACTKCCKELPFQIMDGKGNWERANVFIHPVDRTIRLQGYSPIYGVRLEWETYPQCALYNGHGGPDNHTSLPAAPFEWCLYPTGQGHWTGNACGLYSHLSSLEVESILA